MRSTLELRPEGAMDVDITSAEEPLSSGMPPSFHWLTTLPPYFYWLIAYEKFDLIG